MRLVVTLPGFVDLQVNGFGGVDFNGPALAAAQAEDALDRMRATGVTRCLPTLITSSFDRFRRTSASDRELDHPAVAGIHMEGPYLSPEDGPARRASARPHRPAPASRISVGARMPRQDVIRLVTLAPEVPGALPLIEHLVQAGVRVAIGHTAAEPRQSPTPFQRARRWPRISVTAARRFCPRHPNVIWELLAADDVVREPDCRWPPPAAVHGEEPGASERPQRIVLITDAIAAAGSPPGRYRLGDIDAELARRRARVSAGHAVSRRLEPDDGSRDRQRRAIHGLAHRPGRPDGIDDSRGLSRHLDAGHRDGGLGSRWNRRLST